TPTTLRFFDAAGRPVNTRHVIIQVARSEVVMRREMRGLLFILLLWLPIGVLAAGVFGYTLARRALAPIEQMAERAQSITADRLLRWSRAETGQTRLAQEVINLRELADDVAGYLGVLAEEKQQALSVAEAGTPWGLGDRQVLRQALIDLVDNAIKYTPEGGAIQVRVAESADSVTIDVIDSGRGV